MYIIVVVYLHVLGTSDLFGMIPNNLVRDTGWSICIFTPGMNFRNKKQNGFLISLVHFMLGNPPCEECYSPIYHKYFYTHSIDILNSIRPEYLVFLTCLLHLSNWFLDPIFTVCCIFWPRKPTLWGVLWSELSQILLHTFDTGTKSTQTWISGIFDTCTPFFKLISRPYF